jgi:hypothetical protein
MRVAGEEQRLVAVPMEQPGTLPDEEHALTNAKKGDEAAEDPMSGR